MTFKEAGLPIDYAKKKKIDLFKAWLLEPVDKNSELRTLDINAERDWFALSKKAAIQHVINKAISNQELVLTSDEDLLPELQKRLLVIYELKLNASYNENAIFPVDSNSMVNMDPAYDPMTEIIHVTSFHRITKAFLYNYFIENLEWHRDPNTNLIIIDQIDISEKVINETLTGKN